MSEPFWSPDSHWYKKIPEDAPLHPDSDAMVNWFLNVPENYQGRFKLNIYSYSYPVYVSKQNTPLYTIYKEDGVTAWSHGVNVPIPDGAKTANGTDQSIKIVDWIHNRKAYDGWKVAFDQTINRWKAGAWFSWDLGGSGVGNNYNWVMGGTSTPAVATLIFPEEIEAGVINHPLACGLKGGLHKQWVYPPACNPNSTAAATPYELKSGMRLQLDPTLDISSLNLNVAGQIIVKAMQEYGIMVKEGSGRSVIYAEDTGGRVAVGEPDPWLDLGVSDFILNGEEMKNLPWRVPDWRAGWWGGKLYSY